MASPLAGLLAQSGAMGANPQPFHATVAPTDVTKAYADYNDAMMKAYQAQVAQQNAMYGGLASLGGSGIAALPKLLGSSGSSGGTPDISGASMAALTSELGPAAIL